MASNVPGQAGVEPANESGKIVDLRLLRVMLAVVGPGGGAEVALVEGDKAIGA